MMKFNCFSGPNGRKKKEKVDKQSSRTADFNTALKTLNISLQHPVEPFESDGLKSTSFAVSFPLDVEKDSINVQVMSHESPVVNEAAYEGEDELEEDVSMKRDLSDLDLQSHVANSGEEVSFPISARLDSSDSLDRMGNERYAKKDEKKVDEKGIDIIQSGHVSDPGIGKAEFWGSPKLKRSCSNLETSKFLRKIANQLPLASQYSEELQGLAEKLRDPRSPTSITSHCSADRVMLKKHSSSQVLPSRSRRLWWKLFLWSHRNIHKPWHVKPQPQAVSKVLNQQGGYSSDTLELDRALSKMQSPGSFTRESMNKGRINNEEDSQSWNGFQAGISGLWPQNQWVAFSIESSPFSPKDPLSPSLTTTMTATSPYSVKVSNISPTTTEEHLHEYFTFCGKITSIDLSEDPSPKSAVIYFEKATAAKTALMLNGGTLDEAHLTVASETVDSEEEETRAPTPRASLDQTDKPRAAIAAEYLAKGYALSDQVLQRAIELDKKQGISKRFLDYIRSADSTLGQKALGPDQTISGRVQSSVSGGITQARSFDEQKGVTKKIGDYYARALSTSVGQKVQDFYTKTSKHVLDIHEEAKRLAGWQKTNTVEPPADEEPSKVKEDQA